ncbi:MAG: hypothetical protein ABIQ70_02485 [Dokdonella sp.]
MKVRPLQPARATQHFYPAKNRRKTKPWPEQSGLALLFLVPWREEQEGRQGLVSDTDIPRHPRRRGHLTLVLTMLAALGVAACDRTNHQHAETRHPQQAGQPVNPYALAGHIVAARADLVTGDSRGAQKHTEAIESDVTRSARLGDVSRSICHSFKPNPPFIEAALQKCGDTSQTRCRSASGQGQHSYEESGGLLADHLTLARDHSACYQPKLREVDVSASNDANASAMSSRGKI